MLNEQNRRRVKEKKLSERAQAVVEIWISANGYNIQDITNYGETVDGEVINLAGIVNDALRTENDIELTMTSCTIILIPFHRLTDHLTNLRYADENVEQYSKRLLAGQED